MLLEDILNNIDTAERYIKKDSIIFAMHTNYTDKNIYTGPEGQKLIPLNKEIGSDLCYLYNAGRKLRQLISAEKTKGIEIPQQ